MTRLKFTLRDLFWLLLVVAIGLGWLNDRPNQLLESQARELELHQEREKRERRAWRTADDLPDGGGPVQERWHQDDRREL